MVHGEAPQRSKHASERTSARPSSRCIVSHAHSVSAAVPCSAVPRALARACTQGEGSRRQAASSDGGAICEHERHLALELSGQGHVLAACGHRSCRLCPRTQRAALGRTRPRRTSAPAALCQLWAASGCAHPRQVRDFHVPEIHDPAARPLSRPTTPARCSSFARVMVASGHAAGHTSRIQATRSRGRACRSLNSSSRPLGVSASPNITLHL